MMVTSGLSTQNIKCPPTVLGEACDRACKIVEQCHKEHPYLFPILETLYQLHHLAVDFFRHHSLLQYPGNHSIVLTGVTILLSFFSMYGAATCVAYSILYLLAMRWQKKLPVFGSYTQDMNQLISQTVALPLGSFKVYFLLYQFKKFTPSSNDLNTLFPEQNWSDIARCSSTCRVFLEVVLTTIFKNMETRSLQSRFIYEVRHCGKVTGYLIGTFHRHTWQVAHDPLLLKTVKRCGLFFSECFDSKELCEMSINATSQGVNPYRYFMDAHLTLHAYQHQMNVKILDTPSVLEQARAKQENYKTTHHPQNMLISRAGRVFWQQAEEKIDQHLKCHYLLGDEKLFSNCINVINRIYVSPSERTQGWLYGEPQLLSRLKGELVEPGTDPEKPLCVAAGLGHMLGDRGLLSLLQKEGLTVTRLPQGPQEAAV